jgi:acyl-coenzyme A synthetase/AMP-(fatty) acid ligase
MTAEMTPETTWFRNPHEGYAGTLNLCFNALDRQVIRGKAADIALFDGERSLAYAGILEQVSALAGVMVTLGVGIGDGVDVQLEDPVDQVLLTLAVSRIGAVQDDVTSLDLPSNQRH